MQVKRQALEAGVEKKFEFDIFEGNSVVVKNETADEILFCDGIFDETKAAHIPAFSWQSLKINVLYGEKTTFYVKSAIGGTVEIDFGSSGAGSMSKIILNGSSSIDITFHDATIEIATGDIFLVNGYKTMTVEISGTSTSRTIAFIGRGASEANRLITGVKLSNFAMATSTTGTGEIWQFDITGLTAMFMDLQAVAGGNVTVKGRAVS